MRRTLMVGGSGLIVLIAVALLAAQPQTAPGTDPNARPTTAPASYAPLRAKAEGLIAEHSYKAAHDVYAQVAENELPGADARWLRFRLADTAWRAQASTEQVDMSVMDAARRDLTALIDAVRRTEDRDDVWALAQESLGDSFVEGGRFGVNPSEGWQHLSAALDYWAGSAKLDVARAQYLGIFRRNGVPPVPANYDYNDQLRFNMVPTEVIEAALRIATDPNDLNQARFALAVRLTNTGDPASRLRVPALLDAVIAAGRSGPWYDDALYIYARWWEEGGLPVLQPNGGYQRQPDYVKALELYRRIVSEFDKGATAYFDTAQGQINHITSPDVSVRTGNAFLPDSEVQYEVNWRNMKTIEFSLYSVTLVEDVNIRSETDHDGLSTIALNGRTPLRRWTFDTGDKGDYAPGSKSLTLDEKLPPGAYVLTAGYVGGSATASRTWVLVTDAAVVLKSTPRNTLVWFADALSGKPLAEAPVKAWISTYKAGTQVETYNATAQTDPNGLALFKIAADVEHYQITVCAGAGARQAFARNNQYRYDVHADNWFFYVYTDRPAYRPGETAQWRIVARRQVSGRYETPASATMKYEISSRNGVVAKGELTFNAFGGAWGELPLKADWPLGEYSVRFYDDQKQQGQATLLRLEEYKLPEFTVKVQPPQDPNGQPRVIRTGESVEATVQAEYYFGGPVAGAEVEAIVYQEGFSPYWHPVREYAWYYTDLDQRFRGWYGRQQIKRETLHTDAEGKVSVKFDTPKGQPQDLRYTIEARVTDASRREVSGSGTVCVARQGHYAFLVPDRYVYQPQDRVTVRVHTADANSRAVKVSGTVRVLRQRWREIWLDGRGQPVEGAELDTLRATGPFPPQSKPTELPWRLKFRGCEEDVVLTRQIDTDAAGDAQLEFDATQVGHYRIAWESPDPGAVPVKTETFVWVARHDTRDYDYRPQDVDLVVDRDTFKVGQVAPVMIALPVTNRYVLLAVDAEDLDSYQLVHVEGAAKVVMLPITARHVPNMFIEAMMLDQGQLKGDTEEVIVPPREFFLDVEVKADRDVFEPRQTGTLSIRTRDADGKPVSAEVGLSLTDEAVFAIQEDYAGDPRQFFYGQKRTQRTQWNSTTHQFRYALLTKDTDGKLTDRLERDRRYLEEREKAAVDEFGGDRYEWSARRSGLSTVGSLYDTDAAPAGTAGPAFADALGQGGGGGAHRLQANKAALAEDIAGVQVNGFASLSYAFQAGRSDGDGLIDAANVVVRSDFRATAFWKPDIVTDADGVATVPITFPDSLTAWRATARVATKGAAFGIGTANMRTRQPLIVRLQAPRFFLVGDTLLVSALIDNNTDKPQDVAPSLEAAGIQVLGWLRDGQVQTGDVATVTVPANGQTRVDWRVTVKQAGPVKLKVMGRGHDHADAMERTYLAYEHGLDRLLARSAKLRGTAATIKLDIPAARRKESTELVVQIAPSTAVTMLDALPYLVDYPYGCVEQTMSRFLPATVVARTFADLGLDPNLVGSRLFGGIEQDPNNLERLGPKRLEKLAEVTRASLERLYSAQHGDGGWGWWPEGSSDHYMSAYVVWGLLQAQQAGLDVKADVIARGMEYLRKEIVEEERSPDLQAWMLHALAAGHKGAGDVHPFEAKAFANLYEQRDRLNAFTRALLALAAHQYQYNDQAQVLARNLANGATIDNTPDVSVVMEGAQQSQAGVQGTAHWGNDGVYYRWSDGAVETTSFVLRALLAIDPNNALIEPTANWIVRNRRGAQWRSTRETSIAVLALTDYLRVSGELQPGIAGNPDAPVLAYRVLVNGTAVGEYKLSAAQLLSAPSRISISRELIKDGVNDIRIERTVGDRPLYVGAECRFYSHECPVPPAGNEIFVRRQYYKLVPQPTLLKGFVMTREPLEDGGFIVSGQRVEVVLTVEAKNDLEYLVFEDLKPAGFEAVQLRSGESLNARQLRADATSRQYGQATAAGVVAAQPGVASEEHMARDQADLTGQQEWVYQELRDRHVALFLSRLTQGIWEMRYELRAEIPGEFHALPTKGYAMYVPEIRCNGSEVRVDVREK